MRWINAGVCGYTPAMTRLPPRPGLEWTDAATPASIDIGDVYFSGDGLAEKRAVFLEGCGLPDAWSGRQKFVVAELGFGTGISFLATWELWRRNRPAPDARLHFLSFEGALLSGADAARIHARWPELGELSAALIQRWPDRARGLQRITFPDGVVLTLAIDDIAASLPQIDAEVDAWFLDGFAPSKNPDMWSAATLGEVARLSAPGARAATYTVAGDVRRGLQAVGFAVEKKAGHGRKKERLEAVFSGERQAAKSPPRSVLIVGAGIAGAAAARAFLDRGCDVTVVDAGPGPGSAASGNPLALVMPRLDATDGPAARGLVEAYLMARRLYRSLGDDAALHVDVAHLPRGETERGRFARLLSDPPLDETLLQSQEPDGVRHLDAIVVRPARALAVLLQGARLRFNKEIVSIEGDAIGLASGERLSADLVVVCAGIGAPRLLGETCPQLEGRLGQIERRPGGSIPNAISDGGYVVEAFGDLVFGATFEPAPEGPPAVTDDARLANLSTLARLRPDISVDAAELTSRAAVRATTRDRLPFASLATASLETRPAHSGPIAIIGGLGSRGFLWAPLLAELVASAAFGEPAPVERSVAENLDPDRFRQRALRRKPPQS